MEKAGRLWAETRRRPQSNYWMATVTVALCLEPMDKTTGMILIEGVTPSGE